MSLDNVEEQIPLLVAEIEAFSGQMRKQVGLLSSEAQQEMIKLTNDMQMEFEKKLSEIEDLSNALANTRCNDLSTQLIQKLALIRTYLHG
ncbi:hypothetical protein [Pseudoalteromonas arctica]|uniref:Uncharacterized protein n=1 Tax=Pseudoalteromonas arctica TaxID=394751 RepID=A0A7Y0H9K2_9GAMM|nr:hypothetical protein [Pseudoalteromonas arctica]NMM39681.1 hypothetical protein [Pseudoalteromonas arctica]